MRNLYIWVYKATPRTGEPNFEDQARCLLLLGINGRKNEGFTKMEVIWVPGHTYLEPVLYSTWCFWVVIIVDELPCQNCVGQNHLFDAMMLDYVEHI